MHSHIKIFMDCLFQSNIFDLCQKIPFAVQNLNMVLAVKFQLRLIKCFVYFLFLF